MMNVSIKVDLAGMSKQELRNLIMVARGEWVIVELARVGDTLLVAQGYENNPQPDWYALVYEDELVYTSENLDVLYETDNYAEKVINEEEIDTLRTMWLTIHDRW